ncbi:hypothetical protein BEN44_08740 [Leptospira interrogans serovar Ricardi]|nr:hypothetical protein [Leptospira interrogans serovar Ricardi]
MLWDFSTTLFYKSSSLEIQRVNLLNSSRLFVEFSFFVTFELEREFSVIQCDTETQQNALSNQSVLLLELNKTLPECRSLKRHSLSFPGREIGYVLGTR